MSKTAKLSIGEVLTNRKTGETFTVKELTDTVAVLNNNKGYKLTSILKTYKRATEVITNVNIDTNKMDKAAEPVKMVITSRNQMIKEWEKKVNAKIEKATATATAKEEAKAEKKEEKKATAKTTTKDLTALRAEILGMAGEYFKLEEKTQYTSVKLGNKCVMEIYRGKRVFSIAVSNKYLFEDYINQADSIKKFPNDCYFKVTEESFSKVREIVSNAISNIRVIFQDKINDNGIRTQQG